MRVKGVTNLITVKPRLKPSDVKEKIEQASIRSVKTDADFNKVNAEFKDGVLTVHVPKSEHAQPKQIEVKVA
jgi:HSP20 family molecular chaperone IbpA